MNSPTPLRDAEPASHPRPERNRSRPPRPLTVLSAVALLCLALAGWEWTRPRNAYSWWYCDTPLGRFAFTGSARRVQARWSNPPAADTWGAHYSSKAVPVANPPDFYRLRGKGIVDMRFAGATVQWGTLFSEPFFGITLPRFVLVLLLAILPLRWWFVRTARVRWDRQHAGRCVACGYDLRASPDRCPECGMGNMREKKQDDQSS